MRHVDLLERFRTAVKRGDLEAAFGAASEMSYVGLYDALELVRLLALAGDPRFDAASCRWLTRLAGEKGRALPDLQLGSAAMGVLAVDPNSERAWETLTGLVRA